MICLFDSKGIQQHTRLHSLTYRSNVHEQMFHITDPHIYTSKLFAECSRILEFVARICVDHLQLSSKTNDGHLVVVGRRLLDPRTEHDGGERVAFATLHNLLLVGVISTRMDVGQLYVLLLHLAHCGNKAVPGL